MGFGLWKKHHGIMKSTAISDYETVKKWLLSAGNAPSLVSEPTGKHWHKIENATSRMLKRVINPEKYFNEQNLNRGLEYYLSLDIDSTKQQAL